MTTNNIIIQTEAVVKIRPNLFQLPTGHVIGFGPILAPGGLGYCFTCNEPDCQHVETVDEDWLAGRHSVEDDEAIPFEDEMIFASSADLWPDDYGLAEVTL